MSYYFYNLYHTLDKKIPNIKFPSNKLSDISKKISESKPPMSHMFIFLILEHACVQDGWSKDDILKGIFPYNISVEDGFIKIDENTLPSDLLYILEKSLAFENSH